MVAWVLFSGELIIPIMYDIDDTRPFYSPDGKLVYMGIKQDGKWCILGSTGQQVLPNILDNYEIVTYDNQNNILTILANFKCSKECVNYKIDQFRNGRKITLKELEEAGTVITIKL